MTGRAAALLLVLASLAGCGYATGSLVPAGYRTISVPVFDNTTRRHDLEFEVTDARTGKPVVARRRVTERESFVPAVNESVRTAREEAGRALAERIVRQMEEAW